MKGVIIIFVIFLATQCGEGKGRFWFDQNYYQTYGGDHLIVYNQGNEIRLLIDQTTGAGFSSKKKFGSGYFGTSIKIPSKNSSGINTSFYLMGVPVGEPVIGVNHFEFDFEFFGTDGNTPHVLSTNVFANDQGGKEQLFHLWFDPTTDFHRYEILWNRHQIVWFVDGIPIRVWENRSYLGIGFPTAPMHVEASIWNPDWLGRVDWSQAPYTASYRGFAIHGCRYKASTPNRCLSEDYYWNRKQFWQLSPRQRRQLQNVRRNYMFEDYCNDQSRRGAECQFNQ